MREAENSTFKVCSVDEYMGITWDLVRNIDSHPQALTNWSRLCSLKKIHRLVLHSLQFEKPHNYSCSDKREILPAQGSGKAWRNMTPGVDFKNVSPNFKRAIKICPLLFFRACNLVIFPSPFLQLCVNITNLQCDTSGVACSTSKRTCLPYLQFHLSIVGAMGEQPWLLH